MDKNFNWSHLVPVVIGIMALWFGGLSGLWIHAGALLHIVALAVECSVTEWFTYSDPTGPLPSLLDSVPRLAGALTF
jgi:hypothetical protein